MAFPLSHVVQRIARQHVGTDALGNDIYDDVSEPIAVAGWAVPSSQEPKIAGHDRLTVALEVYCPPGMFAEGDAIFIDSYGLLEVVGHPENYSNSPFGWDPGLVVVNAARTST